MKLEIIQAQVGERPAIDLPNPDFLAFLKEEGIRKMVNDHYDCLRQSKVKGLFPEDPEEFEKAKLRSSDFFIQILGGRQYFNENRGKPLLYKRHLPFKITPQARIVWLDCYRNVLEKMEAPEELVRSFWGYVNVFSIWMVNTEMV